MTKTKTDNDLEERFQWHKGLDPEYIFDEELAMINKLRSAIPQLEKETNKFVACFLFARRHNVEETTKLLQRFYSKKAEFAHMFPGQHIPSFKYNSYLEKNMIDGGGSMLQPQGYRDNKDRMLRYFLMGLDKTSARDLNESYVAFYWQTYYQIATEPLSVWRNGIGIVVDLKHAGLANIDISAKGREIYGAMQGTFPVRVRSMMVVNGNWLVSALMSAAKLVLPKKLYDRIKLMDVSRLKDLIPHDNLLPQFGGSAPSFTYVEYLKEIAQKEEELFAKGIWRAPDGATPAC